MNDIKPTPNPDTTSPKIRRTKHVHRFIIPVEWQYELEVYRGNGPIPPQLVYKSLRTTKLRCSECPEEVER